MIGRAHRAALAALCALLASTGAEANGPPSEPLSWRLEQRARLLAPICASEASVQTETPDCRAIEAVIRNRARLFSVRWQSMARAYSERVFDAGRGDRRRWIAHMGPRCTRPEGAGASWPRARCLAVYQAARAAVSGPGRPCDAAPLHWGGPVVDAPRIRKALRAGWRLADCGETLNTFITHPRLAARLQARAYSAHGQAAEQEQEAAAADEGARAAESARASARP